MEGLEGCWAGVGVEMGDGTVARNKKQRHKHPDLFNLPMMDKRVHDVVKSISLLFLHDAFIFCLPSLLSSGRLEQHIRVWSSPASV